MNLLPKDSVIIKKLNTTQVPQDLCREMRTQLVKDVSNYARGRYRLWFFHEVDFRNGRLSKS